MLNDQFINACFRFIYNERSENKYIVIILEILKIFLSNKDIEIPIEIKNKLDCLKKSAELRLKGKSIDYIYDSIFSVNKFKEMKEYVQELCSNELSENDESKIIDQIILRRKISHLLENNYDKMQDFVSRFRSGNFDSADDLIESYESFIREQNSKIAEIERNSSKNRSLDVLFDGWDEITKEIVAKYDRNNKIPTGFSIFDDCIFYGGFDKGRLYMFGGGSGAGKSTLLINLMRGAAESYRLRNLFNKKNRDLENILVYITLENTIDETIFRLYMSITNKTAEESLEDIKKSGTDIKKVVGDFFLDGNTNIIMKYYPAFTIGAFDIMNIIDETAQKYGKSKIRAVYIDYMDLLISHRAHELYRLELSHIASTLKILANHYSIPVITGTQLNRNIYTISGSDELNLSQISEAIKKAEHSDFVLLMGLDINDPNLVHAKVGKNRCGKNNVRLIMRYDFSRYQLLSCSFDTESKNKKEEESFEIFDVKTNIGEI